MKSLSNQTGIGLIDLLIGVVTAGVVFTAFLTVISYSTHTSRLARMHNEVDSITDHFSQTILRDPNCSNNFRSSLQYLEETGGDDDDLWGADSLGVNDSNNRYLGRVGGAGQTVTLASMTLKIKDRIPGSTPGSEIAIAELKLNFREKAGYGDFVQKHRAWFEALRAFLNAGDIDGFRERYLEKPELTAKRFTRVLGVIFNLTDGEVASCVTGDNDKSIEICNLASDGQKYFDLSTQTCVVRVIKRMAESSKYSASCNDLGTGWTAKGCWARNKTTGQPGGFSTDIWYRGNGDGTGPVAPEVRGVNADGTVTTNRAHPWAFDRSRLAEGVCSCSYSDKLETDPRINENYADWEDDFVCMATCEKPL